jgi:hypothetical protein
VTAAKHQRVCGAACRRRRRGKLARRRRRDDTEVQRADERQRQKKHREAAKRDGCHGPPSDGKYADLLLKLEQIMDGVARLSRATFRREATLILRKTSAFASVNVDGAGRCHEPPSARAPRENGSRSVVGVDGVTDQHGL